MSAATFGDHLADRVLELRRQVVQLRKDELRQRRRAEAWKRRALRRARP